MLAGGDGGGGTNSMVMGVRGGDKLTQQKTAKSYRFLIFCSTTAKYTR